MAAKKCISCQTRYAESPKSEYLDMCVPCFSYAGMENYCSDNHGKHPSTCDDEYCVAEQAAFDAAEARTAKRAGRKSPEATTDIPAEPAPLVTSADPVAEANRIKKECGGKLPQSLRDATVRLSDEALADLIKQITDQFGITNPKHIATVLYWGTTGARVAVSTPRVLKLAR